MRIAAPEGVVCPIGPDQQRCAVEDRDTLGQCVEDGLAGVQLGPEAARQPHLGRDILEQQRHRTVGLGTAGDAVCPVERQVPDLAERPVGDLGLERGQPVAPRPVILGLGHHLAGAQRVEERHQRRLPDEEGRRKPGEVGQRGVEHHQPAVLAEDGQSDGEMREGLRQRLDEFPQRSLGPHHGVDVDGRHQNLVPVVDEVAFEPGVRCLSGGRQAQPPRPARPRVVGHRGLGVEEARGRPDLAGLGMARLHQVQVGAVHPRHGAVGSLPPYRQRRGFGDGAQRLHLVREGGDDAGVRVVARARLKEGQAHPPRGRADLQRGRPVDRVKAGVLPRRKTRDPVVEIGETGAQQAERPFPRGSSLAGMRQQAPRGRGRVAQVIAVEEEDGVVRPVGRGSRSQPAAQRRDACGKADGDQPHRCRDRAADRGRHEYR